MIRALTAGRISGTGLIQLPGKLFGGAVVSSDGTNAAIVTVRKSNENGVTDGPIIFDVSTKVPIAPLAPIDSGEWIYYSITGTGAAAQLYEWVP